MNCAVHGHGTRCAPIIGTAMKCLCAWATCSQSAGLGLAPIHCEQLLLWASIPSNIEWQRGGAASEGGIQV
eukprot:4276681-Amphidinium_carterae.1